jgi:hypothetical protein
MATIVGIIYLQLDLSYPAGVQNRFVLSLCLFVSAIVFTAATGSSCRIGYMPV